MSLLGDLRCHRVVLTVPDLLVEDQLPDIPDLVEELLFGSDDLCGGPYLKLPVDLPIGASSRRPPLDGRRI